MKKLILIFCLFISCIGYSQARMGYEYNDILSEFAFDYEFDYTAGYEEKLGKYLAFYVGTGTIFYYFNEEDICYTSMIIPTKKVDLHYYIEKYNGTYTIIDDHTWHMYDKGVVIIIELIYVEDGGYYFLFYYK